jgi:hypothetical protein
VKILFLHGGAKVGDQDIAKLKKALPKCLISR